eukprot:1644950-Pyramimonas_sp.AAC.1
MLERVRRYEQHVQPILLSGCEGWAMTTVLAQKIHGAEGSMLRRTAMIRGRRDGEGLERFMRRSTTRARTIL